MRFFHFSDEPNIDVFNPRPIRVHVDRPSGQEWLNGALVWATDEQHDLLYLFPRECPRIVIWPFSETTQEDWLRWSGDCTKNAIAFIEQSWEAGEHKVVANENNNGTELTLGDAGDVKIQLDQNGNLVSGQVFGNKFESSEGSISVTRENGAKITVDPKGNMNLENFIPKSVGIESLAEVSQYTVTTQNSLVLQKIDFIGGGKVTVTYTTGGELINIAGNNLSQSLTKDNKLILVSTAEKSSN
ncbi:hypothetical protein ASE93_12205 [Serratia sp. Leaf50]|nr:hypothetical protein ASE93_12205 [Serratia sp. Leaf50]